MTARQWPHTETLIDDKALDPSRHLPAAVRNALERIADAAFVGDGRSAQWVRELGKTDFATIMICYVNGARNRRKTFGAG